MRGWVVLDLRWPEDDPTHRLGAAAGGPALLRTPAYALALAETDPGLADDARPGPSRRR
jgi:hypothetical protein